jgi:hypothetical protein
MDRRMRLVVVPACKRRAVPCRKQENPLLAPPSKGLKGRHAAKARRFFCGLKSPALARAAVSERERRALNGAAGPSRGGRNLSPSTRPRAYLRQTMNSLRHNGVI